MRNSKRPVQVESVPDVDLSECAREPIHIPNAVQPHGALLVATQDGSRITHASANLHEFLERRATNVLGKPLAFALGEGGWRQISASAELGDAIGDRLGFIIGRSGARVRIRSFRSDLRLCVDVERIIEETAEKPDLTSAHGLWRSFRYAGSVGKLCDLAVQGLRSITGYDRVMAYQFGPEGHGEVIAEALADGLEPYLGQRYPASDIPEQARRLYLRQRVGVIADSSYEPVSLLVDPGDTLVPVDLTHSVFRSVSPLHREFMRNMKTAASMTVGIERSNDALKPELWGMIVCHHQTPRFSGPEVRAVAELIGQILSLLIGGLTSAEVSSQQIERQATLSKIIARLGHTDSIHDALLDVKDELLHLVDATGVIIRLQGEVICFGGTPERAVIDALLALLREDSKGEILEVEELSARGPIFAHCRAICSGALMLPLWQHDDNAIVWIRPEQAQTVTWGGNPAKPTQADALTGRIGPRASFAAWKDVVLGRCLPWSAASLALAAELRTGIESQIARRTRMVLDLYGRMFESSPAALMLTDRSGEIRMLSNEAARIFGYARSELVGRPLEQLVPKRFGEVHALHRRDYLANPSLRTMGGPTEIFGLHKDGSEFPVEVTLSPLVPQEVGAEQFVQASLTDLSARRAGERAVRAAQERLHSITTHVPAMIGYWNRELRCEFANTAYGQSFGLPPEKIVGASMEVLLGADTFRHIRASIGNVLSGTEKRFEGTFRKADGSIGYSDARYLPDRDSNGTVRGFYVLVTDVSSLQEARLALEATNAELKHINRELDQFVYTASHDLRSPLRAISSLAQFALEDDASLQQETQDRMRLIIGRSERMQKMLDQILEYARAGKDGVAGKPVHANEVIDDVTAMLDTKDFTIIKDPSLAAVLVQPMPIAQVFQNLIANAIKHHDAKHGTVTVSVEPKPDGLRFWVKDDGPGIPQQYAESVFEMFTTLKRRDVVEASGIGLALVRKLVKLQGGNCGVEPASGRGARIWFDWPSYTRKE
jgi:PAS domain S-box-containing protein